MAPREEKPETLRREPEAASASGGHIAPDLQSTGRYDPLSAPLPSEIAQRERERRTPEPDLTPAPEPERTQVIPARQPTPVRPAPTGMRRRIVPRRVKRTLRHVDPLSVLKVSLFVYACVLVLWMVFVAFLYFIVSSMGLFTAIEDFAEGMVVNVPDITLMYVEKWAFLIGFTFYVIACLINTFLAFLFNVGADIVGGVDVTFVERDLG